MKLISTLFLAIVLHAGLYAQGGCNPPGANTCEASNVLCSLAELDGYSCSNPDEDNPTGATPLCFGTGKPHNTVWWAFIGGGENITLTFNFDSSDCKNYFDSNTCVVGIQAGVLAECGGNPVACNASCCIELFQLSFYAEACQVYYVWVDGCNADVCNYTMGVSPKGKGAQLPDPLPDFYVEGRPCKCNTIDVCVGPLANNCDAYIEWTIDGVPDPTYDDELCITDFQVPIDPVEFCVTWTIGNPNNPDGICDEETKCFVLTPEVEQEVILPPEWVCYETHLDNYQWSHLGKDTFISSSCIDPPCRMSIPNGEGCCIDYVKEITLLPQRPKGEKYKFICDKTPFIAENGRPFREPVCGVDITWKAPWGDNNTLCDTTYTLYFDTYSPEVTSSITCGNCDGFYTITGTYSWTPECINGSYTELGYWITPNFDTLFQDDFEVYLDQGDPDGTYEYYIRVIYTDNDDPAESKICDYATGERQIVMPINVPAPVIAGDKTLCFGAEGQYALTDNSSDLCQYRWFIKQGEGTITTPDPSTSKEITVQWKSGGGNTGILCANILVDCGRSKDSCLTVTLQDAPEPFAGRDTVLCGLTYTMNGLPDVPGGKWALVSNPGAATYDENDIETDVSVDEYGEYIFLWSEQLSTCQGGDTVHILFRPDPDHGPVDTICAGDATSYRVQFDILNGEGPYEIVEGEGVIAGNTFLSDSLAENFTHRIVLKDKYGCSFVYEINYDCVCHNQLGMIAKDTLRECGPATVTIQYDRTGEMLGPKDIVDFVLFSDPADYYGSALEHNSTGSFTFDPNRMMYGKVYYLGVIIGKSNPDGTVDELGGCLQKALQPVIWYEIPRPDAGPEKSICGLEIDLTGVPSIRGARIEWGGTPGVIMTGRDSLTTHLMATKYGRYVFYFHERNALCEEVDSTVVNFNESPQVVQLKKTCLDRDPEYKWYYEVCITKGKPTYSKIKGNGTLDQSTWCFRSNNLLSNTTDTLLISDANGCEVMVPVSHNCDCGTTAAGSMDLTEEATCVDQCITVTANNDHSAQADDCVKMILHSDNGFINPADPVLVIQDYNPGGNLFCFDATTMTPNKVYYVSYAVGECAPSGNINLNDFCMRLVSKPIRFVPYPQPDAGPDRDVCYQTTNLEAQASLGSGRWTVFKKPTSSANVVISDPTSSGSPVSVDEYGQYYFVWTEDNQGCSANDTVSVVFHDYPMWRNVTFECDSVAEHYRMRFEIYAGDNSSYELNGTVSGIQSVGNGRYITPWINQGNPLQISVSDRYACQPAMIDTAYQCDCLTAPGGITADDKLCESDQVAAAYSSGQLDPNDGILFILHDGDAATVGNRIAVNTTGIFNFMSNAMTLNKTYYITAVAGNKKPDGSVDESDRCVAYTEGIPVTWYDAPQAQIAPSAETLTCSVEVIQLDGGVSVNRAGTGTLTYTWSTQDGAFEPGSNLRAVQVNAIAKGTYTLEVRNIETGCVEIATVVIDEDRVPPIAEAVVLGCDGTGMRIDAAQSSAGQDFSVEWQGTGIQSADIHSRTPVVSQSGWYKIAVMNTRTGCVNYDSVEVVLLEDFVSLNQNITCYGANDGQLIIKGIKGGNAPIRYSVNGEAPKLYNGPVELRNLKPGVYTLTVVDDKDCAVTKNIEIEEPEPIDVSAKESFFKEWGENVSLDSLIEEIQGTDLTRAKVEWYDEVGNRLNNTLLSNLYKSKYTFKVVLRDENGCVAEDVISIFVRIRRKVYIPNTISPQSGVLEDNQKLYVFGRPGLVEKVNVFRVYDRWGELIWQSDGPIGFDDQGRSLEGWNTTFRGNPVKPGVYVYYAEVAFKDLGEGVIVKKLTGDVTVIR